MEIVDAETHRALLYLATLLEERYRPTVQEAYAYGDRRRAASVWNTSMAELSRELGGGATVGEDESTVDYLQRMQWVVLTDDRVHLTESGRALERALRKRPMDADETIDVILDPEDPIVFARLVKSLADVGPGMLVDPYFRLDHLTVLLETTQINRILTSEKTAPGERSALALAVQRLPPGRPLEVRVSNRTVHDRHVIGDDGRVLFLGASLNGVGRTLTVVGALKDGAGVLAAHYNEVWRRSTRLQEQGANSENLRD